MALSRKKKVYLCLLGLALVALVIDRVFLAPAQVGAQQAAADQAVPAGGSRDDPVAPPPPPGEPPGPKCESLAARLRSVRLAEGPDHSEVRDAFLLPQPWKADLQPGTPTSASAPAPQDTPAKRQHHLMAVMVGSARNYAIIDGQCLLVGQEVNGLKLISVGQAWAVLEEDGVRVRLELEEESLEEGSP